MGDQHHRMAKQGASQVSFAYKPERIFWWIRWGEAERGGDRGKERKIGRQEVLWLC